MRKIAEALLWDGQSFFDRNRPRASDEEENRNLIEIETACRFRYLERVNKAFLCSRNATRFVSIFTPRRDQFLPNRFSCPRMSHVGFKPVTYFQHF